jgi:hypothetical protein
LDDPSLNKPAARAEPTPSLAAKKDTATLLERKPELNEALADNKLAARAFKKKACLSPCYPDNLEPHQIKRLEAHLRKIQRTGDYNEDALRKFLADRSGTIDDALNKITGTDTARSFDAMLRYFNEGPVRPKGPKGPGQVTLGPKPEDLPRYKQMRSQEVGETRGRDYALQTDRFVDIGFVNPFRAVGDRGFDDVMKDGNIIVILEYKGGGAGLIPGQMELEWVIMNIKELHNNPKGDKKWAAVLAKALREGRLRGRAYSTRIVNGVPQPTELLREPWNYPPFDIQLI